jgi:O-antigen/teichoic acid export membrane protein
VLVNKIKDTVSANILQQLSSTLLFLLIPRILSVENYAIVVFVGVLLSFASLGDFGFSFVYSRKMPAIYHVNNLDEINQWNATAFWLGIISSLIVGVLLAVIYYLKFNGLLYAVLIFLLLPMMALTSFYTIQFTSREDFTSYRNLIIVQSGLRLLAIPLTLMLGLLGWFINQFIILSVGLKKLFDNGFPALAECNKNLIRTHVHEGILLILTFFIWNQLLGSGRLFAAFHYEKSVIAVYGLMNTGYQILSSLLLAIFIPFSVSTLKMIHIDDKAAIQRIFKAIYIAMPCILVLVVLTEIVTPYFFTLFFKKYHYDAVIFKSLLYCLFILPIVFTLGNVYISKQKTPLYIALLVISFSGAVAAFYYMLPLYNSHAAAFAQLFGITTCAMLMLGVACYVFSDLIDNKLSKLSGLFGIFLFIIMFEYWVMN